MTSVQGPQLTSDTANGLDFKVADLSLADVRVIRDDIRARIAVLLDELGATEGLAAGV